MSNADGTPTREREPREREAFEAQDEDPVSVDPEDVVPEDDDDVASPHDLMNAVFMGDQRKVKAVMSRIPQQVLRAAAQRAGIDLPPEREPAPQRVAPQRRHQPSEPRQHNGHGARRPRPRDEDELQFNDALSDVDGRGASPEEGRSVQELLNEIGPQVGSQLGQFPGLALGITFHPTGGSISLAAFYPGNPKRGLEQAVVTQIPRAASGRLGDAIAGVFQRIDQIAEAEEDSEEVDDEGGE